MSVTYQNLTVKMLCMFSVSTMASKLCIPIKNTNTIVKRPAVSVTICRSIFSETMKINIAIKITIAAICVYIL